MRKLLIICSIASLLACDRTTEEDRSASVIDSLEAEINELKEANDTLSTHLMKKAYSTRNYPSYFDTIPEPEKFIKEQLQKEPDLIPKEGVLGGTMRFTEVTFIDNELITAAYEDGHVMGKAVYSYSMNRSGKLQFTLVGILQE